MAKDKKDKKDKKAKKNKGAQSAAVNGGIVVLDEDSSKLRICNVRMSFPHIFAPQAAEEGQVPKFSAAFLLSEEDHAEEIAA